MSDKQDFSDIGEKIRNAMQDAVESCDFKRIHDVVSDTMENAMDEVRYQFNQVQERILKSGDGTGGFALRAENQRKRLPSAYINKKGRISGILYTVFGSIGLGLFGFLTLGIIVGLIVTHNPVAFPALLFCGVPAVVCGGMLWKGCGLQTRLRHAERYLKLTGEKYYMEIEDLAARTGWSVRKIRKDIRGMLNAGIFPEGHMDEQERMFVLDDDTWELYLTEQKKWRERQRLEELEKQQQNAVETPMIKDKELSEEAKIEQEGREYMDRLRQLNVEIPGEVISNKLYKLDYLLQRIFMVLKEHPEKCSQMQKFMDYYLPTTVKLVESYADFDKAGIQGDNITTAKTEIEKTMDTINEAFEKLLDDMYQNAAFEVAADAKVLKTILAQDGYMKSEFSVKTEEKGEA